AAKRNPFGTSNQSLHTIRRYSVCLQGVSTILGSRSRCDGDGFVSWILGSRSLAPLLPVGETSRSGPADVLSCWLTDGTVSTTPAAWAVRESARRAARCRAWARVSAAIALCRLCSA